MEGLLWGAFRGTDSSDIALKLVLCVICGGIIGLERGAKGQAAGFRTHILVCMGASVAMMTGQYIYEYFDTNADPARLGAQVISGIGFLGAGSIIVEGKTKVRGLTTAAGLWTAACIGLAIGIGFYFGGVLATGVVYVVISKFKTISDHFTHNDMILRLYVEFDELSQLRLSSRQGFERDDSSGQGAGHSSVDLPGERVVCDGGG